MQVVAIGKEEYPRPLAERSAILLLLLVNNCRSGIAPEHTAGVNPYRAALTRLVDSSPNAPPAPAAAAAGLNSPAKPLASPAAPAAAAAAAAGRGEPVPADFRKLFKALVVLADFPVGTALLYALMMVRANIIYNDIMHDLVLQTSSAFSDHIMSRADVDELLLPYLQAWFALVPTTL